MKNETYRLTNRSNLFDTILQKVICTNNHGETENTEQCIEDIIHLLQKTNENGSTIYVIGNGGSAAVASHAVTDFVNACHLRSFTLHESSLMTCMANDFGYEVSFKTMLKSVFKKNDVLIGISSSGQSPNIHHAIDIANQMGGITFTLTGFKSDNILRKKGIINFWLDSSDYGLVEIGHLFILHNMADRIGCNVKKDKKIEYSFS